MKKTTDALLRALKAKAESCTPAELKSLLDDFGDDPKKLDVLQRAVDHRLSQEDRGSYCENASPGYNDALTKKEIMDEFQLRAARQRSASTPPSKKADMNKDVLEALAAISRRLDKLEAAQKKGRPIAP